MKSKWVNVYMEIATVISALSVSKRLKVGSLIVKDNRILSSGYNGTPAGWDNNCEDKHYCSDPDIKDLVKLKTDWPYEDKKGHYKLVTLPEVLHSEENAVIKLARDGESGSGATLFCTHACCLQCAKLIYGAGIKQVYYGVEYRDNSGIEFLKKAGLEVYNYSDMKKASI